MAYFLMHAGQPSAKRLLRRVSRLRSYQSSNSIGSSDIVIRWGASKESDPVDGTVINPRDAIERTTSRTSMGKFLRRVGVRFIQKEQMDGPSSIRFLRHYRVPLYDFIPLACFRSDANPVWLNHRIQKVQESFREISFTDEKVTMRVIYLAIRTLHALGLDMGLVSIGMAPKGVLYVLDVSPIPVLEGRLLELYSKAIEDYLDREDQIDRVNAPQLVLGTDMEVMLRNAAGKMVLASEYFPRKGRIGCDDRSVQFDGKRLPLMELRPDPDTTPLGLISNLKDTMVEASSVINRKRVEWRAGSMPFRPYCTGGHIHFSNVPLSRRMVCVLDNFIGLPLMLVEDPRTAQLRRPRYGFLGDVRQKDYGGFEYRTPASFIVDPDVTAAAFCLAYLAAVYHRELPVRDLYEPNVQLAFYRGNKELLLSIVQRNLSAIRRVPLYERFRDYIEPLAQMIDERRAWDEGVDVRAVWGIPLARPAKKRDGARVRKASARVIS